MLATSGVLNVVDPPSDLSVVFYLQAVVAMVAQVVHNTGGWVLIDQYFLPGVDSYDIDAGLWRDISILLAGLVMLILSGTLDANAAIR